MAEAEEALNSGLRRARELRLQRIRETHLSSGAVLDNRQPVPLVRVQRVEVKGKSSPSPVSVVRLTGCEACMCAYVRDCGEALLVRQRPQAQPAEEERQEPSSLQNIAEGYQNHPLVS
jgi:hypothetical protein